VAEVPPRARRAAGARHAGLFQAPALSPRQPDSKTSASSRGRVNEAARIYTELSKAGAGLEYLDAWRRAGRRLRRLADELRSSVNYTLEEYATTSCTTSRGLRRCRGQASHDRVVRAGAPSSRITAS
jgi:hypothetical protein